MNDSAFGILSMVGLVLVTAASLTLALRQRPGPAPLPARASQARRKAMPRWLRALVLLLLGATLFIEIFGLYLSARALILDRPPLLDYVLIFGVVGLFAAASLAISRAVARRVYGRMGGNGGSGAGPNHRGGASAPASRARAALLRPSASQGGCD